jgi:hypothetical protein
MSMLEKTKIYVRSGPEFFFMYKSLLRIDPEIIKFLLQREFIGRVGYLYLDDYLDEKEAKPFTEPPNYYPPDTNLEYTEELLEDPRYKEGDFYKKTVNNLTNYFTLLWEILSHAIVKGRKRHSEFLYHKQGIDYELSDLEAILFELEKSQIEDMFESVYMENKKTIKAIGKIICFTNFEAVKLSKTTIKYVSDEVEGDKSNKRLGIYIPLVKLLLKINDSVQAKRVSSFFIFSNSARMKFW